MGMETSILCYLKGLWSYKLSGWHIPMKPFLLNQYLPSAFLTLNKTSLWQFICLGCVHFNLLKPSWSIHSYNVSLYQVSKQCHEFNVIREIFVGGGGGDVQEKKNFYLDIKFRISFTIAVVCWSLIISDSVVSMTPESKNFHKDTPSI